MKTYLVWDKTTRWFHWINALCIIGLIIFGLFILNNKAFGVSKEGKLLLKTIHAYIGYVFVLNLLWRLVWGFIGGHYSRWRQILPFHKGYLREFNDYLIGFIKKDPPSYKGHNPVAKLAVTIMMLLMLSQAVTGLVLAGTDLYLPPFGHEIAEWITGSGEQHEKLEGLTPLNKKNVNPELYAQMREFRKPYINFHLITFYVLSVFILLHIIAVVVTEIREKNSLISSMFSGYKGVNKTPKD